MTELKTLKDISRLFNSEHLLNDDSDTFGAIRIEAIKWIKELEKIDVPYNYVGFCLICQQHMTDDIELRTCEHDFKNRLDQSDRIGWIDCFKHFFNITAEELK